MKDGSSASVGNDPVVDFEVAKVARVLRNRKGDGELTVSRRGKAITVRLTRHGSARGGGGRQWIAQLRPERAGRYALYWARAVGGWEEYGFSGTLDACLHEIRRDVYGCFWG